MQCLHISIASRFHVFLGFQFSQLTRDGEVYHDYCLNYSKAITYLEQLRKNDDFVEFEKASKVMVAFKLDPSEADDLGNEFGN
jgi:hypothetical protein